MFEWFKIYRKRKTRARLRKNLIYSWDDYFELCTRNPMLVKKFDYIDIHYKFIKKHIRIYNILKSIAMNTGVIGVCNKSIVFRYITYKIGSVEVTFTINLYAFGYENNISVSIKVNNNIIKVSDEESDIMYYFLKHRMKINEDMNRHQQYRDEQLL